MKQKSGQTVSIHDVARRAGVSIASVSRALNHGSGAVSEKTRALVLAAADELNYSPNHIGRALRAQTTNTFALILSNIQNNFFAAVAWELERLLNERGWGLLLYSSNEDPALQDRCLEDIRSRQVSGVYLLCAVDSPRLREMARTDPIVLINRRVSALADLPFVGIDDRSAAREMFLAAMRRCDGPIGIIRGPHTSDTSMRRIDGMMEAARMLGRDIDPSSIVEADLSMESGFECATRLLASGPRQAIFCGNDQIAYGAYRRCRELGIKVPDDVQIYGFDDNPLNEWLAPWLNTVRVPHLSYASSAVALMTSIQAGGASAEVILPYLLISRG